MSNQVFPTVIKSNIIPSQLGVLGWSFPKNQMGESVFIKGEEVKKLLTLDINISPDGFASIVNEDMDGCVFSTNYPCLHACPGCFNNIPKIQNPILTFEEVKDIINQGIKLGLESVKFLGPGELLINPNLFTILDFFAKNKIMIGIFTKGAVLGSDFLAQRFHGIKSQELVNRLVSYPNITFLVGGRSFDPELENRLIPTKSKFKNRFDYFKSRNLAIERLCKAGMNNPEKQRLSIQTNPVTFETVRGVWEIFKWGAERCIPVCITTTMVSGKGHSLVYTNQDRQFQSEYVDLAVKIYSYLIKNGFSTINRLKEEGVSAYVGIAPCNQVTHGLYIHYDGSVWRCPGNDQMIVHSDIRQSSLLDIWLNSVNYRIGQFNNRCPAKDGITIPSGFYDQVLSILLQEFDK